MVKRKSTLNKKYSQGHFIGLGMVFGMIAGLVFLNSNNGLILGMILGLAIGASLEEKAKKQGKIISKK